MAEPGRRLLPNTAAAIVLIVLVTGLLLWLHPWTDQTGDDTVPIPSDAVAQISQMARELTAAGSKEQWSAAMGASAAAQKVASDSWDARRATGVESVSVRYVTGGEVADRADGSTQATLDIRWRASQQSVFPGDQSARVAVRLAPQRDGSLAIRSVGPASSPLPVWLAGQVTLTTSHDTTVVRIDGGDAAIDVEGFTQTARQAVVSVLPDDRGDLTVISPSTSAQTAAVLGQDESDIAQIAAVTTRLNGGSNAPAVVVLNPAVYATMDARADQVVLSHEATHVLTNALGTSADTWVVEGFADFVALHSDPAPVTVSAAQIIQQVRADGVPRTLPSATEFSSARHGLGAVYESAWLIFRTLEEVGGREAVVGFYRDVIAGVSTSKALEEHVGLTIAELTQRWQAMLRQLAK